MYGSISVVNLNDLVVTLKPSEADTVKVYVCALPPIVPVITPAELNDYPVGKLPPDIV